MKSFFSQCGLIFMPVTHGSFIMGTDSGSSSPKHKVTLTEDFYLASTPVTNKMFEAFFPEHKKYRGVLGFSSGDDEAALFVSRTEAEEFCKRLSEKENRPFRLPTEAEWEYACGGEYDDDSRFFREQKDSTKLTPCDLTVGKTPANRFGLCDMNGLCEEWCHDIYGQYEDRATVNPVGALDGDFYVTRGGSHNTGSFYTLHTSRAAALSDDRNVFTGFRVACGRLENTEFSTYQSKNGFENISHEKAEWKISEAPVYTEPVPYIHAPTSKGVPFYSHNHCPAITFCDNGDLLCIWFSCPEEASRDMTVLAARKRYGDSDFGEPFEFFNAPARNMTGASLLNINGRLLHINGIGDGFYWSRLALCGRLGDGNGEKWGKTFIINPEHGLRNQPISGTSVTENGDILQCCDATFAGSGGSALYKSSDGGITWKDMGRDSSDLFSEGSTGFDIAGIHAGLAALDRDNYIALGRGDSINGKMPCSSSHDGGKTWEYSASEFEPVSSGQRLVLKRLIDGSLLLVSFADASRIFDNAGATGDLIGIDALSVDGKKEKCFGLFAALSTDGGKTWEHKRVLGTAEKKELSGGAWTGHFLCDRTHAEPLGYLAATQTPDGMIHVVSSRLYYSFNTVWLKNKI